MEIELRNSILKKVENIIHYDFNVIGLGSESCPHKLPAIEEILKIYDIASDHDKKFRLITPITPQSSLDFVLNTIQQFIDETSNGDITINDLGVLHACQETILNEKTNHCFNIGLGIVVSLAQCAWIDHILRDESNFIRDAYLKTNMNHDRKIRFLQEYYGIKGVEVPYIPKIEKSFSELKNKGLEIIAQINYIPVAYARACHTARFYKIRPPNCVNKCEDTIKIKLEEIFDLTQLIPRYIKPDPDVKKLIPDFWLVGNVLYRKELISNISDSVDCVVLDSRFYSNKELKSTIEWLSTIT